MKRLMKKVAREEVQVPETYIPLKELDEADVKLDRCPICHTNSRLEKINGDKVCKSCHSRFKMFDGKGYLITE